MLKLKRIYEDVESTDGFRILVDRLWPRGLSKEDARLDLWLKDIAPSPGLRTWFNHDPDKFAEFRVRYETELDANPAVDQLKELLKQHRQACLLYAARDPRVNHAVVLKNYLENI